MMIDELISIEKEDIPGAAHNLTADDIKQLVVLLGEKHDKVRYPALLLLQSRSECFDDVYPHFDTFTQMLKSDNSYQRSIGFMLMAENAKWDAGQKLDAVIDNYLCGVDDEKPITARQCIQALERVVPYKENLLERIACRLILVDISKIRPTMQKLILMDILNVLLKIRRIKASDDIDAYIADALWSGVLDEKTKKQISKAL